MLGTAERPLRIAVIGAGPSGFFAADALLKKQPHVSIDIFDRLPTPYGLVRYGVAPDHQKIKSVTRLYQKTCEDPRIRFYGNVDFGSDLTRDDARHFYDAILYAVGASSDRSLGIPGEDLAGSLSATEFVAWYNGHPDYTELDPPLDAKQVVVVGMGNVAVDVTRILAKSVDDLRTTDITNHALARLEHSAVEDIYMLGRRGPAQAKFTTKELRELGELTNADVVVDPADLELDEASEAQAATDAPTAKNIEIMRDFAQRELTGKPRRVHLRFFVSPVEIIGDERVEAVKLERNRLDVDASGYQNAVGTGAYETLPVGMVLRSVGYRGVALPGVPFDQRRGVIPNKGGRVLQEADGEVVVDREYVAGWIKRGPSGVIGTNKADAMESVEQLLTDLPAISAARNERDDEAATPGAVEAFLEAKGVSFVTFDDWLLLDKFETERGKLEGRPRIKVVRREEMLVRVGLEPADAPS